MAQFNVAMVDVVPFIEVDFDFLYSLTTGLYVSVEKIDGSL